MKIVNTSVVLKHVAMTSAGAGIFLGNERKVFVIYVDLLMGEQIRFSFGQQDQTRPLTFDFLRYIFGGFDIKVQSIIIYNESGGVFFAKVICKQEKDHLIQVLEMDVRPSDAILLALNFDKPIYVDDQLFERLPDAKELLNNFEKLGG